MPLITADEFLSNPSHSLFYSLKKEELICLAKHFELSGISKSVQKVQIQEKLLNCLIESQILTPTPEDENIKNPTEINNTNSDLLHQIKLRELELKEKELEMQFALREKEILREE